MWQVFRSEWSLTDVESPWWKQSDVQSSLIWRRPIWRWRRRPGLSEKKIGGTIHFWELNFWDKWWGFKSYGVRGETVGAANGAAALPTSQNFHRHQWWWSKFCHTMHYNVPAQNASQDQNWDQEESFGAMARDRTPSLAQALDKVMDWMSHHLEKRMFFSGHYPKGGWGVTG